MHGINFGCRCEYCAKAEFPPAIKHMFKKRIRPPFPKSRFDWLYLKGIAQNIDERDEMQITVENGHRRVQTVERKTASGIWYGIYND